MSDYVQESKRGALALLFLLLVMATGLYCKGREAETPELTTEERMHRALALDLQGWELEHPEEQKAGIGSLLIPCEQRLKRDEFVYEFGPYRDSANLLQKDREKIAQREYWYTLDYSRTVVGYLRAGLELKCNEQPHSVLIEEAWLPHLSEEDEELLKKKYIEALQQEIDALHQMNPQSSDQPLPKSEITRDIEALIAYAYEKFGITRQELGR
jgi:hypothetical protein